MGNDVPRAAPSTGFAMQARSRENASAGQQGHFLVLTAAVSASLAEVSIHQYFWDLLAEYYQLCELLIVTSLLLL